jgi:RNA polymerase sigma factor (sigma-70 family)
MANAPLGTVLRQLRGLIDTQATEAITDGQLLRRFTRGGDEMAFAALLRRHGPMVLAVGRRVLGHVEDAEDVLQATFMLLARKAASIRQEAALGGWLHAVAFRLAVKAKGQAKMRQEREIRAGRAATRQQGEPGLDTAWRELLAVLDEEVGRLPRKYREPLVLCYLGGKTQEAARRQLGCPLGTVRSRLAQARKLLRTRLTRRGLTLSVGTLATVLAANSAEAALPALLFHDTLRAGLRFAADPTLAGLGSGVSAQAAALVREGMKTMSVTKMKIGIALFLLVSLVASGAVVLATSAKAGKPNTSAPTAAQIRQGRPPRQDRLQVPGAKLRAEAKTPAKQMTITGRVLTPEGKTAAKARVAMVAVSTRPLKPREEWVDREEVLGVAKTDRKGRFRLPVRRTTSGVFSSLAMIAAARGYGLAWQNLRPDTTQRDWVLRLRPEQVVRGRLIDLQGHPAARVKLYLAYVGSPEAKENRDVGVLKPHQGLSSWPGPVTTDARGRFVVHGLGRNLLFGLRVRDERFAFQDLHHLATRDEKSAKEITLTLEPPRLIEGRIIYADTGKPAANAGVSIRCFKRRGIGCPAFDYGEVKYWTDAQGSYRGNCYPGTHFSVSAYAGDSSDTTTYLGVASEFGWPKGGVVRQQLNLALPRGVLVRGKITETPSGKPVGGVKVSFWPQLTENKFIRGDAAVGGAESGKDGSFQLAVLPGPATLLFLSAQRKHIQQLVYRNPFTGKITAASTIPEGNPNKSNEGIWYIDAMHRLNLRPGVKAAQVKVVLRRGHTVDGRLVGPDGKPVDKVQMLCHAPNARSLTEPAPIECRKGHFTLTGCDPDKTYPVIFLDAKHEWGAVALISGKRVEGKPPIIRLASCGSAEVRVLDSQSRPIQNYRPNPYGFAVLLAHPYSTDSKGGRQKVPAAAEMRLVSFDRRHYPYPDGLKSDAQGRITFPALIPGATYQLWERGSKARFKGASGKVVKLADIKVP